MSSLALTGGERSSSHQQGINGDVHPQPRPTRVTKLEDLDKVYDEWRDFVVDAETLIEKYDLNLRSNGGVKNVWKCREEGCLFKISVGRKNGKGVIVVDRKLCFFSHNHNVSESKKTKEQQADAVVKKEQEVEKRRNQKKLKLKAEEDSDHEAVVSLTAFLNKLAPGVFNGLERVFLSVGLTAPLLSDTDPEELGGVLEALRNARYLQKSLDEALITRFQRRMNNWIEGEQKKKGMKDVGVGKG